MRILVVEDEPSIAQFVRQGLTEAGHAVDLALNGRDGLSYALAADYDVLVLDIMLPQLDGLKLLRELRRRGDKTPTLMLTARDTIDDRVAGLDAGADDYLVKPFAFPELMARIRALLRRPPLQNGTILRVADLEMDTAQALLNVAAADGQLYLQSTGQNPNNNISDDFVIHLLAQDEAILDSITVEDELPNFTSQAPGSETQWHAGEPWRVYRQAFEMNDQSGWIQVAQEQEPLNATLASLRTQFYWGLPLALLIAGLGGYFLASRALRPIDHITQTAQAIHAGDMKERIHYDGPADEVGRLAETFDTMLDRLQTAFERERRFTADAAHELRTPLAALKGRIGVTLNQQRQPEAYIDTLQDMEKQVDRLIRLSNDLLFMARLDQGQLLPQVEKIDGVDFLEAVVDQIRPLATLKSITIWEQIPPHLFLKGDIDLLIRLFLNLLDNAVKYTPQNGRVSIQATADKAAVQITIHDTGPGIAPEALPHLFERFYRGDSDRTRQATNNNLSGAGLGLGIAYEIARIHGGTLTVQSELGNGAAFTVRLPHHDQTRSQSESHS